MEKNNKVIIFFIFSKTTKYINEKKALEVQMLLLTKTFVQSSCQFFSTDIYMVHTNMQKEGLIETFVLVLLFNIQHAPIAQVYTQAHCILPTLPTHINKACITMHIITVYVPFFIHTHHMHSFLPCMKISPVSFPCQPVSNACSNIRSQKKESKLSLYCTQICNGKDQECFV